MVEISGRSCLLILYVTGDPLDRGTTRSEVAYMGANRARITTINGINNILVNVTNLDILHPWIAERTHTRQEPGCNRQN